MIADTNMNLFEKFKVLKEVSDDASFNLDKFTQDNKKELINVVANELKQIPGINKIIIKGYTPGFNDGDACTHSSEPYYSCTQRSQWNDFSELAEYGIGIAYFLSNGEIEDDEDLHEWDGFDSINTYAVEDEDKVSELVGYLEYLIEETYYTNYIVYIDLTGDEPTVDQEEYYCGY